MSCHTRGVKYSGDILDDFDAMRRRPTYPDVVVEVGLLVEDRASGFCGDVVRWSAEGVTLQERGGYVRHFTWKPGGFLIEGRPVTLVVHPKRNKSFGYLIVGVAAASPWSWAIKRRLIAQGWRSFVGMEDGRPGDLAAELAIDGADTKMRAWMADAEVERSIRALTLEHGIDLALESGWLRAKWMPIGAFIFPGRFDERKWREVLAHMRTLAVSLETAGARA